MVQSASGDRRRDVGETGERAVREHVQTLGWKIVDHNVRWREGELDLIAIDGRDLVVAEVKTLVGRGAGGKPGFSPFESIGLRKQSQIRMLTRRWLVDDLRRSEVPDIPSFSGLRFDAFAVTLDRTGGVTEIEHLEDAF